MGVGGGGDGVGHTGVKKGREEADFTESDGGGGSKSEEKEHRED